MIARVRKFVPNGSYGFLVGPDGAEVFFHLWVFDTKGGPPPIVGERVTVEIKESPQESGLPRADWVSRTDVPPLRMGSVTKFDPARGYGFVMDTGGETFYLHKSDVTGPGVPTPGSQVRFYVATHSVEGQRPRACHVTLVK